MPPENTDPVTQTGTNEFEFESTKPEAPRIRKRSLKSKPAAGTSSVNPPATQATRPAATPDAPRTAVYAQPVSPAADSRPAQVRPSTGEPIEKPQAGPASGVLYYTSASNPQKTAGARTNPAATQPTRPVAASTQPVSPRPATTSMQSSSNFRAPSASHSNPTRPTATGHATHTPQMSSSRPVTSAASTPQMTSSRPATSAASTPQTSATRPASAATTTSSMAARAVSTTVASPAPSSSSRPAGVSDYRSNIDRQSREQKSIGGILNIIVYGLIAFFVIAAALAGYGAHDVYKQLKQQSVTVSDLDSHYATATQQLADELKATQQAIIQTQSQLNRTQELAVRQQDSLTKLQAALDAQTQALRDERATRAAETSIRVSENSALRARVRDLEEKNEAQYRP